MSVILNVVFRKGNVIFCWRENQNWF